VIPSGCNPLHDERDDEVGSLSGGDAVIGAQAAVRDLADQRGQGVSDQSRRDGYHLASCLRSGNESLDVLKESFVDVGQSLVEPLVLQISVPE
jgi:hypothetical protein